MERDHRDTILDSLRRITRAMDRHNKELGHQHHLTVPQLICLRQVYLTADITPGELSRILHLSRASLTGILDRLEAKRLIRRKRCTQDRRQVGILLTPEGSFLAASFPASLLQKLDARLTTLDATKRNQIDESLNWLADLLEHNEKAAASGTAPVAKTAGIS